MSEGREPHALYGNVRRTRPPPIGVYTAMSEGRELLPYPDVVPEDLLELLVWQMFILKTDRANNSEKQF